jgi:ABC-2 type transport system permease protein
MSDLTTMVWKEWRELRAQSGELGPKTTAVLMTVLLAMAAGIAVLAGPVFVRTPILLLIAYTPVMGVLGIIGDAFAGERERHTLETLLASRLRSEAILVGKITMVVLYGYASALLLSTILVVGANAKTITEPWILPTLPVTLALVLLTPLILLFFSSLGVLISMRAATVRQAQSRFMLIFMSGFVSMAAVSALTPGFASPQTIRFLTNTSGQLIVIAVWFVLLSGADLALMFLAWGRFRRDRLIEIR